MKFLIKNKIKKIIIKLTPSKVINLYRRNKIKYASLSYSQEGEDMILKRIFENKKNGFYVDVGAHHPKRFSNTYYFYLKGWMGINIDAMPNSMKLFEKERIKDINLEIAISDKKQLLTYYIFNESALNSFSKNISYQRNKLNNYKIISQQKIQTNTLKEILDKYLPQNTEIDFMSIDVEGFDYKILKSNDWQKYKPKIVLIEDLNKKLTNIINSDINIFMQKQNYQLFAKTFNTIFFKKNV